MIELPQRIGEPPLAHTIHLAAELGQHWNGRVPRQPLPEPHVLAGDPLFSRWQLVSPAFDVVGDDGSQVVEVIQEDVVDARDTRLDVSRHRDVENTERSIATTRHRRLHAVERHDRPRSRCRAEEQVHLVQRGPALLVVHRERAVSARQLLGALVGPVRNDRGAHALVHQTFQRELRHLAGTENHRAATGQ